MAEKPGYESLQQMKLSENPKEAANVLSVLSFSWMNNVFAVGNRRPLENDDLLPLINEDKTQTCTKKIIQAWNAESEKRGNLKKHLLFRSLVSMFPWTDYAFLSITAFMVGVLNSLQPVFLSFLLPELISPSPEGKSRAFLYAAGICFALFVRILAGQQYAYRSSLLSIRWKTATMGMLFQKVLHLRQVDLAAFTSGYILDLVCGDLQRIDKSFISFMHLIEGITGTLFLSLFTWYLFGWKPLTCLTFLLCLVAFYSVMGSLCCRLRSRIAAITDDRLRIMNSVISGIRAVKMYAWEWMFGERVKNIRSSEMELIRWKSAILACNASLLYTVRPIAIFISLVTLVATGTPLSTYNTFIILSVISVWRVAICWSIPQPSIALADFFAGLERIQHFLEFHETRSHEKLQTTFSKRQPSKEIVNDFHLINGCLIQDDKNSKGDSHIDTCHERNNKIRQITTLDGDKSVTLHDVQCSWNSSKVYPVLKSVSLSIKGGDLVFITGHVGCGKSSLLYAILKELPPFSGRVSCNGKIAYVGQQPWVFSGTVRDNILFGQTFDSVRYNMVLESCDLREDIQRFPDGDMTGIGQHGVMLSGGQRARVALARALYANADIYLLDDPLSAIDAKVGRYIFEKCILDALGDKTRLMVTHTLQLLEGADRVVLMKEGSVITEGSYENLLKEGHKLQWQETGSLKGAESSKRAVIGSHVTEDVKSSGLESDEDRLIGTVSWKYYWRYLRAGLDLKSLVALSLFCILAQGSLIVPDWWLLQITRKSQDQKKQLDSFYIFAGLVGGAFFLSISRAAVLFGALLNSSANLHDSMLLAVLKAPVFFFDTNPSGRILNRFSRDIGLMDELLPDVFVDSTQLILFCVGSVVLLSVLNPWVLVGAIPLIAMFILIGNYYMKTSRELKRLEALNRSSVISHFSDTLEGLVTIRAFEREGAFMEELFRCQDSHNQAWFMILSGVRWLGFRLDVLCFFLVTLVLFGQLIMESEPGVTALSLVYTLQLVVDTSQFGVIQCSEVESFMTSVERVVTYTQIEQEPGYQIQRRPSREWPDRGEIQFRGVSLVYYQGGPEVLRNLSFTVHAEEKVAIAGRTGAGKSSIVAALFRMPEATGEIIIDDVSINNICLQSSRRAISVITQDPILFTGSLRMNLDPFDEHGDNELWDALEEAGLTAMVQKLPWKLSEEVREGGINFSVGERQLLCLARALLKKSRIIVMDEATANVDYETDRVIQETIRAKFKQCTVITIAHRLNTIKDCDRVLVLDDRGILGFDRPENLLEKKSYLF